MTSVAVGRAGFFDHLDMAWPPMAHVRRGWDKLTPEGQALVARRMDETLGRFSPPPGTNVAALRRFLSFLAQVEVIAIEVPLSAIPTATPEIKPLLERQLADEVFHSAIFAATARRLGGLDRPIPEAERVLDEIRKQSDPKTTAVLLNLIAEGWIENLFDHAATWGVADPLFQIVLEDESRHVEEAMEHAAGLDVARVEQAVRSFETQIFQLAQHPRVMLPMLALAGEDRYRALAESFLEVHKGALAQIGLRPVEAVQEMEKALVEMREAAAANDLPRAKRIEPETQWRRTALQLWDVPRSPVMNGWFEVRVDHVQPRLLTAVFVAAVGRVWAENRRLNRYTVGGELYEPATVNVGVRVVIDDAGEALSTIVIPEADKRSVDDIDRILKAGVARMREIGERVGRIRVDDDAEGLAVILRDEELMGFLPPEAIACPVTISNLGRRNIPWSVGAMPGAMGQSVELILGRIQKRPVWHRWRYKPTDTVIVGAGADHRVLDGVHSALAIEKLEAALSPEGVRDIMERPDTIPRDADLEAQALATIGLSQERSAALIACKAPFWLGWLCWLFKK